MDNNLLALAIVAFFFSTHVALVALSNNKDKSIKEAFKSIKQVAIEAFSQLKSEKPE